MSCFSDQNYGVKNRKAKKESQRKETSKRKERNHLHVEYKEAQLIEARDENGIYKGLRYGKERRKVGQSINFQLYDK